jgi:hypothetical protein
MRSSLASAGVLLAEDTDPVCCDGEPRRTDQIAAASLRRRLAVRRLGSGFLQFVGLHVEEFRLARETDSLFFEDRHQHLSELFLLLA